MERGIADFRENKTNLLGGSWKPMMGSSQGKAGSRKMEQRPAATYGGEEGLMKETIRAEKGFHSPHTTRATKKENELIKKKTS